MGSPLLGNPKPAAVVGGSRWPLGSSFCFSPLFLAFVFSFSLLFLSLFPFLAPAPTPSSGRLIPRPGAFPARQLGAEKKPRLGARAERPKGRLQRGEEREKMGLSHLKHPHQKLKKRITLLFT